MGVHVVVVDVQKRGSGGGGRKKRGRNWEEKKEGKKKREGKMGLCDVRKWGQLRVSGNINEREKKEEKKSKI